MKEKIDKKHIKIGVILLTLLLFAFVLSSTFLYNDQPEDTELRTDNDWDDDGLTNTEEERLGTNPLDPDTDGDGLTDYVEVNGETDPLDRDTDGDGLDDGMEVNDYNTDPTKADTDGDSIEDGDEVGYETDPLEVDTDDDGLNDSEELFEYSTDPLEVDTDDDGLNDSEEVNKYETNPTKTDTDNDKLADGEEVEEYNTDPLNPDTDGDTLLDGVEVKSFISEKANPLEKDIFLEIDYEEGVEINTEGINKTIEYYDDAPVKNPNGNTGINIHVVVDSLNISVDGKMSSNQYKNETYKEFDSRGYGFYHIVVVDEVKDTSELKDQDDIAIPMSYYNAAVMSPNDTDDGTMHGLLLHELGHIVGNISSSDYEGVDTRDIDYDTYSSAMNYNSEFGSDQYNTGEPFDDWDYFIENWVTVRQGEAIAQAEEQEK